MSLAVLAAFRSAFLRIAPRMKGRARPPCSVTLLSLRALRGLRGELKGTAESAEGAERSVAALGAFRSAFLRVAPCMRGRVRLPRSMSLASLRALRGLRGDLKGTAESAEGAEMGERLLESFVP